MKRSIPLSAVSGFLFAALVTAALYAGTAMAQQKDKKKTDKNAPAQSTTQPAPDAKTEPAKTEPAPAPLFQGKSNLRSSRQSKDSATAGFNGIGPNGELDKKLLDAAVTGDDEMKADMLANMRFKKSEVDAFVAQGGLKSGGN